MRLFVIICFSLVACTSPPNGAVREPARTSREGAAHVIFLIHGFRDDGSSFHDTQEILRDRYKNENVRVKLLQYPSVDSHPLVQNMSAFDFAKIVNAQIISFLYEEGRRDAANPARRGMDNVTFATPYTIIAHSQGGLVAMNFLNSCFLTERERLGGVEPRCSYSEALKLMQELKMSRLIRSDQLDQNTEAKQNSPMPYRIRNLVTLGTPFWGSPVANAAQNKGMALNYARDQLPTVQLQNLAIGGRTTSTARIWMLDRYAEAPEHAWTNQTKWKNRYPPGLRVWNVSGQLGPLMAADTSINLKRSALDSLFWPNYYEHDLVVAAPEARVDFIYQIENSVAGRPWLRGRTTLSSSYVPLKLAHMTLFDYPTLAGLTWENVGTHPVMKLIDRIIRLRHEPDAAIKWSTEEKNEYFAERLANFTSEIKIITPTGYNRRFRVDSENVRITAQEPEAFEFLRLPSSIGVWAEAQNPYALRLRNNFYQTYYHIGRFKDSAALHPKFEIAEDLFRRRPEGYRLNYEIEIPGFRTKSFSVRTMPSYTSYTEIYIQPDLPVPPTIAPQTLVAALPMSLQRLKLFHMRNGELVSEIVDADTALPRVKKMAERCTVGFVAEGEVDESDRASYITTRRKRELPIIIPHFFHKLIEAVTPDAKSNTNTGEPLEILGRVSAGYVDPRSGVHRPCTYEEKTLFTDACLTPGMDRYLVTSPAIRRADRVGLPENIDVDKGLRWIDVMAVDIPRTYPYATTKRYNGPISRDRCLLGDSSSTYMAAEDYRKFYFYGPVE